jgi:cephalosporin hydroxylase
LVKDLYSALDNSSWMGVRALKNPLDAWIYQEIIHETRPETILELGSAFGGGTLFFCNMLDLIAAPGQVVSVDHSHAKFGAQHPRIVLVTGDSREKETIARALDLCRGQRTMMIHDASHDAEVVLADLHAYSPAVSSGCYLVVEDGVGDVIQARKGGRPTAGPLVASERFASENGNFEIDDTRERFVATYNPRGFLRRR